MPKKKSLTKKSFLKRFTSLSIRTQSLFIFGALFLGISLIWNFNQTIQLAFFTPHVTPVQKAEAIPTQLVIKKVNIDLPVEETAINNGVWQISGNVSHLTISARPGEKGPIIMYGHNTNDRLGPIRWLSIGDIVQIKSADNKIFYYKITKLLSVSPNQMDIFTNIKTETLVIYTCDGFADLKRFVVIAAPEINLPVDFTK